MDKQEAALARILKSKYWVFAERMIIRLDKATRPIASDELRDISGCAHKQKHTVIGLVRRYYEKVEGTTLNRSERGYYVGNCIGDHIDQATDQVARVVSHVNRHGQTMHIIGVPPLDGMSNDDRAALTMHRAFGHVFGAVLKIAEDSKNILMHSEKNKRRLLESAAKAKNPFGPLEGIAAARADSDDDDTDE